MHLETRAFVSFLRQNRKICLEMITNIPRYHTAVYYLMSVTRDRFELIRSHQAGVKARNNKKCSKKNLPLGAKNAIQNNMIQQHRYHGGLI